LDDLAETGLPALASPLLRPTDGDLERLISAAVPLLTETGVDLGSAWFSPTHGNPQSMHDRVARWCQYRNNRVGHGVVAVDVREEALSWLPQLAEELVSEVKAILPNSIVDDELAFRSTVHGVDERIPIPTLRLMSGRPAVLRDIRQRGDHWQVRCQALDPMTSPESCFEFQVSGLTELLKGTASRYRAINIECEGSKNWRPTVLLPARQTDTFEGRKEQLAELAAWLSDIESRACNLYGDGGIGKTTLVLELLNRWIDGRCDNISWFPDVVCFFSAKLTRWGPEGLVYLKGVAPPIEDAVRALAGVYEEPAGRDWQSLTGSRLVAKVETLLSDLGVSRRQVLLVLDNTETLARSAEDEERLAQEIESITRRLARVLITSRRRERMEAKPIALPPLTDEEAMRLVSRLAETYNAGPILQAGQAGRRKFVTGLGGHPIRIDACCRLVGRFGFGLENAVNQVLSNADMGNFLYEDAWARLSPEQRVAIVALAQLGDSLSGDLVHFICAELSIDQTQVLNALEETKFATRFDYATRFDIRLEASALAFLGEAFTQLSEGERRLVGAAASKASKRRAELVQAQGSTVFDRVSDAFRTDASKAAWQAVLNDQNDDALFWYEEAIKVEPGNAQLLDRFAFFLSSRVRDLNRAALLADEACKLDPSYADAFFTAGHIAATRGDPVTADERLEEALRLGFPPHRCYLQMSRARAREIDHDREQVTGRPVDLTNRVREAERLLRRASLTLLADDRDHKHQYEVGQVLMKLRAIAKQYGLPIPQLQ
jgi:Tfp pilus assembly protein PilF